jgi:fatty acid synthase
VFFLQRCCSDAERVLSCMTAAGALNFRDVMLAYGKLSRSLMTAAGAGSDQIGLEFSGKVW